MDFFRFRNRKFDLCPGVEFDSSTHMFFIPKIWEMYSPLLRDQSLLFLAEAIDSAIQVVNDAPDLSNSKFQRSCLDPYLLSLWRTSWES